MIVEAAESTPDAAKEAAGVIRKFLGKDNVFRPHVQYNAIMLVRILADNPGPSFTRNLDGRFVQTVKELLREGRDAGVQQILRETLDAFETQRGEDATLGPLITMWRSEKTKWAKKSGTNIGTNASAVRMPLVAIEWFFAHKPDSIDHLPVPAGRLEPLLTACLPLLPSRLAMGFRRPLNWPLV